MSKRPIDSENTQNKRATLIAKDNEVHSAVLLKCDGTMKEIKSSMTDLDKIIGGQWTYHGGWDDFSTMMIVRTNPEESKLTVNKNKLQPPYHKLQIKGDIVIIKNANNGDRIDYFLKEYEEFLKLEIEPWELEEGNDVEYDDDEDPQQLYESILTTVISQTQENLQRELTEKELSLVQDLIETVSEELRNFDEEDQDSNPDITKITDNIKDKVFGWFKSTYKHEPSADEKTIIETTVSGVIVSATVEGADDDDDEQQKQYLLANITNELIKNFATEKGREPNEEECEELTKQAEELVANMETEGDFEEDEEASAEDDGDAEEDENGDDDDEEDEDEDDDE